METNHATRDRAQAAPVSSASAAAYLRAFDEAHAELSSQLSVNAQCLSSDGPFPAAAALHRRLTRQFLDGQRALLRRWALAADDVHEILVTATEAADATVQSAYETAGIGRNERRDTVETGDGVAPPSSMPSDDPSVAAADLQRLLDEWWQADCAVTAELLAQANEHAELVRSLARIEAGEILASAEVPSLLPPPAAAFHERELLPADVASAIDSAHATGLVEVCDTLLRVLGEEPPVTTDEWAPPVAAPVSPCVTPADSLPAPDVPTGGTLVTLAAPAPERAEPTGEDAFRRFWGEGSEHARGPGRSIVRHAIVSMLAFSGVLTLVMALIG